MLHAPARALRRTTLATGTFLLLVLAVLLGTTGLTAPAYAAEVPGLPTTPSAPASPLAASITSSTPIVVTGGTVRLSGGSPSLGQVLPGLPALPFPQVSIQRKGVNDAEFQEIGVATPADDGSYTFATKQLRSAQYRALALAPLSEVPVVIPELVASDPITVTTRGTVSLAAKRVAKRTYTFSGVAAPVVQGQAVTLQVKRGKLYRTVTQVRTASTGAWSAKVKLPRGKRTVRVVSAATPSATGATAVRVVRVR